LVAIDDDPVYHRNDTEDTKADKHGSTEYPQFWLSKLVNPGHNAAAYAKKDDLSFCQKPPRCLVLRESATLSKAPLD
jgi:hypothetical protein